MAHNVLPGIAGVEAGVFVRAGCPGVGGIEMSLGGLSRRVHSIEGGGRPGSARRGTLDLDRKAPFFRGLTCRVVIF
jgi:hypothetical protein